MIGTRSALNMRGDSSRRFLPWIIAFMVFLASLAIAGAMVVTRAVDTWGEGLVGTMTVQIPPPIDATEDTDQVVSDVVDLIRATPGVAGARALDRAESRALLDPWLGTADGDSMLPLPRLIDIQLRAGTSIDTEMLRTRVRELAPGALVDDHAQWLGDLADLTAAVQLAAAAVVAVIFVAAVLTVIYATRSGVAVHFPTIEVLHLIGARDNDIARQFEMQAFLLGLFGGIIGFAVAAFVLAVAGYTVPRIEITTLPRLELAAMDWVALGFVPVGGALLATLTARATVLRALARMM